MRETTRCQIFAEKNRGNERIITIRSETKRGETSSFNRSL